MDEDEEEERIDIFDLRGRELSSLINVLYVYSILESHTLLIGGRRG